MNEERFFRAYKALKDIETADDLRRVGLTLAEFCEAQYCLQKYAQNNGEDGQTNLFCSVAAHNANNRFVTFAVPCDWEFDAEVCVYSREIKDVFLSRQNLDRIATECYRKFMQTR